MYGRDSPLRRCEAEFSLIDLQIRVFSAQDVRNGTLHVRQQRLRNRGEGGRVDNKNTLPCGTNVCRACHGGRYIYNVSFFCAKNECLRGCTDHPLGGASKVKVNLVYIPCMVRVGNIAQGDTYTTICLSTG
jgi:hypothetical protein